MSVTLKRAYEPPGKQDGVRILVDGLWPRGLSKEKLKIDTWVKEMAPSPQLRNWYGHRPERWEEFRTRYRSELAQPPRAALVSELAARARKERVTLVFAARDAEHSNAKVILEKMREKA